MKIKYLERGPVFDYKRVDHERTLYAQDYFQPEGTSLLYFRIDRYNIKTIAAEDIISITGGNVNVHYCGI